MHRRRPGHGDGSIHAADPAAAQGQLAPDRGAHNNAFGTARRVTTLGTQLGGRSRPRRLRLGPRILRHHRDLTLNGQGNPNAVFIFQTASTLITAAGNSRVDLINGAQSCNVFWQVGSSATLGTNTLFRGNILALTAISATTGAVVDGRLLARMRGSPWRATRSPAQPTGPDVSPVARPWGTQ